MIPRGRLIGLLACLTLGLLGAPPAAEAVPSARVVLVSLSTCCPGAAWPQAERAVRDELAAAELQVVVEQSSSSGERARRQELKQRATSKGAHFSVCIERSAGGGGGGGGAAELWIFDALTDKTLFRQVPLGRGQGNAEITGLRVVEIMRASLLEYKLGQPAAGPAPEPIERLVKDVELRRKPGFKRLAVALGPTGWGSTGGLSFVFGAGLELRFRPWSLFAFGVDGALSLSAAELSGPEGRADFGLALYRLWVHLYLPLELWRITPVLSLGAGRATAWTEGSADSPYGSASDQTSVTYLGGAAELNFRLTEHLYLVGGLRVGALTPTLRVSFGRREVAHFGAPLFGGYLNLQLRLL